MYSSWGNDYLGQALQRACHIEPAIKRYGIDELTAWVDMPLPETVGCIDMGDQKVIADETVREVLLSKCGARTIPEFQLHTKDRQKDIVRDVMRELGAGPRQMVRVPSQEHLPQTRHQYGPRSHQIRLTSRTGRLVRILYIEKVANYIIHIDQ